MLSTNGQLSQVVTRSWFFHVTSDLLINFRRLVDYRGLLYSLVIRDLRIKYKSSFLGFFWSLLHPLLMMGVYSIIFSILIRQVVEGPYPIFLLAGILPWLFFAGSLTLTAPSLLASSLLINKVYFPREVIPLSIVLANLVNFVLSIGVFLLFMLPFGIYPGKALLLLPLLVLCHLLFTSGLSLLISMGNVYFRDIAHIIDIVLQLWFFSVPIIYSVNFLTKVLDERLLALYYLNPMVLYISMYRDIMMYSHFPTFLSWFIAGLVGILVFCLGYRVFKRYEYDVVKEL